MKSDFVKPQRTRLYPMVQFKKDTWEIDEFDCASIFVLVGTEKALVIDCGIGIGDLRGAIESITDKPLIVVLSHGHLDHTGNARQFDEIWMPPADQHVSIPQDLQVRKDFITDIANRQKGCLGLPFTMFNLYPFDIDVDVHDPDPDELMPVIHDLLDGQSFDLGGGRMVTAYSCPGHTPGEMIFLDEQTRTLFAADALNFNLYLGKVSMETSLPYYKRMQELSDKYDHIYNGHHDFRAFGAPLDEDCLPTIIKMMENTLAGHISPCQSGVFGEHSIPLIRQNQAPSISNQKTLIRCGRCFMKFFPDYVHASQND